MTIGIDIDDTLTETTLVANKYIKKCEIPKFYYNIISDKLSTNLF